MIAEAVPDASARVFVAERKAAAASAGTSTAPAPSTSKTPSPPPPAVSASFARNNPWTDLSSPLDARERLLLLLLGVPLLLWRLLLTALILPCVHGAFCLLVAGQDLGAPLSPLRARCTNALLRFWSGGLLFLAFGVLPRIKNERSEWDRIVAEAKAQRAVVVFNHVSYLDGLAVVSLLQPCCAAKRQVASMPFFGVWSRALQFLFIERDSSVSDSSSSAAAAAAACSSSPSPSGSEGAAAAMARRAADARFPLLAVSPEGTTKAEHCLLRFKSGAFVSGRPVLPLCLDYRRRNRGSGGRSGGKAGGDGKKRAASLLLSLLSSLADRLFSSSNFYCGWGLLESDGFHLLRAYTSPWTPLAVEALPLMRPRRAKAAAGGSDAGAGDDGDVRGGEGRETAAAESDAGDDGADDGADDGDVRGGEGRETAAAESDESPAEFAERVREAMSLALGAPRVDLGVEDWARLKGAGVAVDRTGTRVLWRPNGPGTERVEVPTEEEEQEEVKKKA